MSLHRICLAMFSMILTSTLCLAQSAPLPAIVESTLNEETLAVGRINLNDPQTLEVSKLLANSLDPIGPIGMRYAEFDRTLRTLAVNRVTDLYVVISTYDLPDCGATLVVPLSESKEGNDKVAKELKQIWKNNVQVAAGGIIVSDSKSRVTPDAKTKEARSDFAPALATVQGDPFQFAINLGNSSKRVLRETLPIMFSELDAASATNLADGWKWISLGIQFGPKRQLRLIVQAKDDTTALNLKQTCDQSFKHLSALAEKLPQSRQVANLIASLNFSKDQSRLSLALSEDNQTLKSLLNDFAAPLVEIGVKNSLNERTRNNIKQIMLAMHNYHDTSKSFPPRATFSKDGKPLLSWRVAILPYLGEGELYSQFRQDEPWDSDHNKQLISKMPQAYVSPNVSPEKRAEGFTSYVGLVAPKSLFGSVEGVMIRQVRDGTSNTIAIVDANGDQAVPWTKPMDLPVDLKKPLENLIAKDKEGFYAGICDGSVRRIPNEIKPETLGYLIQIDDGHPIEQF